MELVGFVVCAFMCTVNDIGPLLYPIEHAHFGDGLHILTRAGSTHVHRCGCGWRSVSKIGQAYIQNGVGHRRGNSNGISHFTITKILALPGDPILSNMQTALFRYSYGIIPNT